MNDLNSFLTEVQSRGLQLPVVYDIGANIGLWSKAMASGPLHKSKLYLFEGNPRFEPSLKAIGFPYHIGVLCAPGVSSVQFFNRGGTGDSYYKENTAHYDGVVPTTVVSMTLAEVAALHNLPQPDFIKMDTQGSELDIIAGGERLVINSKIVYLECPIIEYNTGAPDISRYLAYMYQLGFTPVDMLEIHRAESVLLQVDIMFMRNDVHEQVYGKTKAIRL